ncbi:MAG: hypothetical protein AAFO94_07505, partial [Bacteroidota bacterium]
MNLLYRCSLIATLFLCVAHLAKAHDEVNNLIPVNTATHTAKKSGSWFDQSTWLENEVPNEGAIVVIPAGMVVSYEGESMEHIFAIRVDGTFAAVQTNPTDTTRLIVDTFVGTSLSKIQLHASDGNDGYIEIILTPFDIEAHKLNDPTDWNTVAKNNFSDGKTHYEVSYEYSNKFRYKTFSAAQAGTTYINETASVSVDDGAGILGRTEWDSTQLSLGIVSTGEVEFLGQEKSTMARLSADANKGDNSITLETAPTGWEVGDTILITRGGNINTTQTATELAAISGISGTTITLASNLRKNHEGRAADDLHCYVGNLFRNIIVRSAVADSTHRGHFMAVHNATNVQIKNTAFIDMGRTDKGRLLDDLIWSQWQEPPTFNSYVSPLGQHCAQLERPDHNKIRNHRGRYSIHLHQLGAANGTNIAQVTGNVVWGNPGWGITHHDSHANVSENVVYDVTGAGIVSEAGNETGFWDNNLVVDVNKGHTTSTYEASVFFDDYLYSGQGLGMKGRGVVCRGNVIVEANMGIGIVNFNAAINNTLTMDADALASVRPNFEIDQFPLSHNGYSKEGDGVMPVEVALIIENTTIIWSNSYGFSSIERDMGVNHESRSVFHNMKIWGADTGVRITYQNDYSFRDLFISGRSSDSQGLYIWKHAHNHSFEGIKLVDLEYGITCSKLVEKNSTEKTRNNGYTPWLFLDLETENVTKLYGIFLEDPSTGTTTYTEHPDNTIHLSSTQLSMTRPITFTLNDNADLEVDVAAGDFQFKVDGVVTDRIGAYEFGIEQAPTQNNLRTDYPERIYEFASQTAFENYLSANGVYRDPDDPAQLYFIINELVPDRITYEYRSFPVRVKIMNHPTTGVYASPQDEPAANFEPTNQLISRFGTATQSSTSTAESFRGTPIPTPATRAIDGNSN